MAINIKGIGHVGLLVSDMDRSFKFYTEVLGCIVTHRTKRPDGSETAFLRFDEDHHNIVLATAPDGLDVTADGMPVRLLQQIAMDVENRDEFLRALAHVHSHGVELISGPAVAGPEGGGGLGGSGSHHFYFLDPDGNRLEIFYGQVRVPNGEQFPREEYAEVMKIFARS
jgi:catechol 2,3-dioxygenase-like lactoylglutathione lyase family enzyme